MKTLPLSFLLLLAAINPVLADDIESIPVHKEAAPGTGPKLIQSYHDVLAVIPEEFSPGEAKNWTEVKKSVVNVMLKENVVDVHAPARFRAKVSEVAHWPGLTLCWEIPNQEGYHIRLFAGFTDDWQARLSVLNVGDEVIVEGTMNQAKFEKLWGDDTLCLCVTGSSFSRATEDKPVFKESTDAREVRITSAVFGTESQFADVTHRVDELLHRKIEVFTANPEWLEVDPAYGLVKSLVIVYEFEGQRHIFSTTEGGEVNARILMDATKK